MPNKPETLQSLSDRISEIQDEAKKNKVQLTPEIQAYIREHLEAVQQKLANREPVYDEDLEFIKEARSWIKRAVFVKKLELQYDERLETLKHYGFLSESGKAKKGDVPPPSIEKAMGTFKPEELEIASHFQKPMLLLVPETSFAAKIKALDAHKQGMQGNDTYVYKIYTDSDSGSDKITGWRVVIVDGAQEMEIYEGDDLGARVGRRIENRKKARKPGEKGMDRHRYVLLMMEGIKIGNPIDLTAYTLLDDDPALSDSSVPNAGFLPGRRKVSFGEGNPEHVSVCARFRSSVGGDVLLT